MLVALTAATSAAAPVSEKSAREIAGKFLSGKGLTVSARKCAFRAPAKNAPDAPFYIFDSDSGSGFVIVSGEDTTPAILGYSDSGDFDENNLPDNFRGWLESCAAQIEAVRKGAAEVERPWSECDHTDVAPLITTQWNQSGPYNDQCPYVPSGSYRAVTGCVATAFAQVLYYHRAKSVNEIQADIPAYDCLDGQIHVEGVEVGSPIEWDKMTDKYTSSSSAESKEAVAALMRYCGAALQMGYGLFESGVYGGNTLPALHKYFGYTEGKAKYIFKSDYPADKWYEIIHNELLLERPVLYCGFSDDAGHSYVIDGYRQKDDLFHINWGWGGSSDGYYLLAVCAPGSGGIGSGSSFASGYRNGHQALINAEPGPDNGLEYDLTVHPAISATYGFYDNNKDIRFAFWNNSGETASFEAAPCTIGADGTVTPLTVFTINNLGNGVGIGPYYYWTSLPAGVDEMRIYPMIRLSGTDEWVPATTYQYIVMRRNADDTIGLFYSEKNLSAKIVEPGGMRFTGLPCDLAFTVSNDGDYIFDGEVYCFIKQGDGKPEQYLKPFLHLNQNTPAHLSTGYIPEAAGTYTVSLCYGDDISTAFYTTTVDITDMPADGTADWFTLNDFKIKETDDTYTDIDGKGTVYHLNSKNDLSATAVVHLNRDLEKEIIIGKNPQALRYSVRLLPFNDETGEYTEEGAETIRKAYNGAFSSATAGTNQKVYISKSYNLKEGKYKIAVTVGYARQGNDNVIYPLAVLDNYRITVGEPMTLSNFVVNGGDHGEATADPDEDGATLFPLNGNTLKVTFDVVTNHTLPAVISSDRDYKLQCQVNLHKYDETTGEYSTANYGNFDNGYHNLSERGGDVTQVTTKASRPLSVGKYKLDITTGYRCYQYVNKTLASHQSYRFTVADPQTTGIENVSADSARAEGDNIIYAIDGRIIRRCATAQEIEETIRTLVPGIYIANGKKYHR